MAIESATFISQLDEANPKGTDQASTLDNHDRLMKTVMKNTLPNLSSEMSASSGELNVMVGVDTDLSAGEINLLKGLTATIGEMSVELNNLKGMTAVSAGNINALQGLTSTVGTELNLLKGLTVSADVINNLDGLTATGVELNQLDGATIKTLSKDHGTFTATYTLDISEAQFHVITFSADATLHISSSYAVDKAMIAIKGQNFTVALAGIDNSAPTLSATANTQDIIGISKSFGKVTCVGTALKQSTT